MTLVHSSTEHLRSGRYSRLTKGARTQLTRRRTFAKRSAPNSRAVRDPRRELGTGCSSVGAVVVHLPQPGRPQPGGRRGARWSGRASRGGLGGASSLRPRVGSGSVKITDAGLDMRRGEPAGACEIGNHRLPASVPRDARGQAMRPTSSLTNPTGAGASAGGGGGARGDVGGDGLLSPVGWKQSSMYSRARGSSSAKSSSNGSGTRERSRPSSAANN